MDVCCGTGTIGLCLADKVKNVVGVDIVAEAVRYMMMMMMMMIQFFNLDVKLE